jgi:hypothetical protein
MTCMHACMHAVKSCPFDLETCLGRPFACDWATLSVWPINNIHSDAMPMLSCGRNGTGSAWALASRSVQMTDFA